MNIEKERKSLHDLSEKLDKLDAEWKASGGSVFTLPGIEKQVDDKEWWLKNELLKARKACTKAQKKIAGLEKRLGIN